MNFDIVVIGTGLSSLSFIDAYLEKKEKINVISPDFNKSNYISEKVSNHLFKDLPPQMESNIEMINNYFALNKIEVEKSSKILGTLEFGGLSNYWGLQIDQNIKSDLRHLSKKTREDIEKSFLHMLKKLNLAGVFKLNKEEYKNDYEVDHFFKNFFNKKINGYDVAKPILAFSKKKTKTKKILSVKEDEDKLTPKNFLRKFINKKKVIFHNYAVEKIFYNKGKLALSCFNQKEKKTIYAKKVIIGCGTIVTTKLVLDLLNIKKEVKIKHHPRLMSLFFSKSKIDNKMKFMPAQINLKNKNKSFDYSVDFRPGNKLIIEAAVKLKKYLSPLKFMLHFFMNYFLFSNILLNSKFSNLFIKINNNSYAKIYSKRKNKIKKLFNKINNNILNVLLNENLILPLYKKFFPGFGADFHYFGTIPISRKKTSLSVNENCQLKNNKNIYIIDGSVFDFKTNKYPLGLIMANARRVAKKINEKDI